MKKVLNKLMKSSKNTKELIEQSLEIKKKETNLNKILNNMLFNKEYKKVEKEEGTYICLEADEILSLVSEITNLKKEINNTKNNYKKIFKKKEETNNDNKTE